jgi:hypothetical protein
VRSPCERRAAGISWANAEAPREKVLQLLCSCRSLLVETCNVQESNGKKTEGTRVPDPIRPGVAPG